MEYFLELKMRWLVDFGLWHAIDGEIERWQRLLLVFCIMFFRRTFFMRFGEQFILRKTVSVDWLFLLGNYAHFVVCCEGLVTVVHWFVSISLVLLILLVGGEWIDSRFKNEMVI